LTTLNVRCCCAPKKILGTLEVPSDWAVRPGRWPLKLYGPLPTLKEVLAELEKSPQKIPYTSVVIDIRRFQEWDSEAMGYNRALAVYSDDHPIEFWRKIPGFKEAK